MVCARACVCLSSQLDSIHQSFVKSAPKMPNSPLIQEPPNLLPSWGARMSPWPCLPPWYTEALQNKRLMK